MYVSKCRGGGDGTQEIYRRREERPYPPNDGTDRARRIDVWENERRVVPVPGTEGPPSINSGRDDDRRLECGACNASKTCRGVFLLVARDAFSLPR